MTKDITLNPYTGKPINFTFDVADYCDRADAPYVYLITIPNANDRFEVSLSSLREELIGQNTWDRFLNSDFENDSLSDKLAMTPGPRVRDADVCNACIYLHSHEIAIFFEEALTADELARLDARTHNYMASRNITKFNNSFIKTNLPALSLEIVECSIGGLN